MTERYPLVDMLTGAVARNELGQTVENLMGRHDSFALLLIDLDYFKSINDAFGHICGDEVLAETSRRLQAGLGQDDILVRYGGDEFVVLLPGADQLSATAIAERLMEAASAQPIIKEPPVRLSLSIGIALYPRDGESLRALLSRADERVYSAKRRGRGLSSAEDAPQSIGARVESLRIIERDAALAQVTLFLRHLGEQSPGQLRITSDGAVGRSRLLAETERLAAMFGYGVLSVKAQSALRFRPGEALRRADCTWDGPAFVPGATTQWIQDLLASLRHAGRTGLVVTVDDIAELDAASCGALRELFFDPQLPPVALVYTLNAQESDRQSLMSTAGRFVDVRLAPLSTDGVRVLLRELLRWEPTDELVAMVHEVTQGRPGWIQRGLARLSAKGLLQQDGTGRLTDQTQVGDAFRQELAVELSPPVHHLPRPITRFVGREEEIQQAKQLLEEHRLVTLMGPGGVGKSRLSLQVAHEQSYRYPGGAHFISLASVQSADLLPHAIASAFRLTVGEPQGMIEQLRKSLRDRDALIVLDNMEHLLDGVPLLVDMLSQIPSLQLLVTSRERLGIQGEVVQELGGLTVPGGLTDPMRLGSGAVQLFLDRVGAISPGYQPTEEDWKAAVSICRTVQGTPLGIELAAAQTRLLSWKEVAEGLAKSLDFLSGPYRDLPPRHRSLRAAFLHSWEALTPAEQRSFARLTIFHGPFDREAVAAVTGTSLDILTALVDKSLVRRLKEGRYEIHPLLRQYAAEQLGKEYRTTAEQHAQYFLEQAVERDNLLSKGGERAAIFDWYEVEHENLRVALRWYLNEMQPGNAVRLAEAMWHFWGGRGYVAEGRYWFETVLAAVPPESPLRWTTSKARLHTGAAVLADEQGRPREALVHGMSALEIQRKLGARREVGGTLNTMGITYFRLGEYGTAIHYFEQSLEIARETKEPLRIAITLNSLGSALLQVNDLEGAKAALEEGLTIMRQANPESTPVFTINLANVAWTRGDYETARRMAEETLEVARRVGRHPQIISSLYWLGRCDLRDGQLEQAEAKFLEGMELATQRGFSKDVPGMLVGIAGVMLERNRPDLTVWLLGYTERLIQRLAIVTQPTTHKHVGLLTAACEQRLPQAEFTKWWNEAGEVDPHRAVAFVLDLAN